MRSGPRTSGESRVARGSTGWGGEYPVVYFPWPNDEVLPINDCSRRLVPRLERAGYSVTYVEFDGAHAVPAELLEQAGTWLATAPRQRQDPVDQAPGAPHSDLSKGLTGGVGAGGDGGPTYRNRPCSPR
jgi:hypothetical protein